MEIYTHFTPRVKRIIGAIIFLLVGIWLSSPYEIQHQVLAPNTPDAHYGFGDTRSIGQSFVPVSGLREIRITMRSPSGHKGPVILHIRNKYFDTDIRTIASFQPADGPGIFQFTPLYTNTPLTWVLEAPTNSDRAFDVDRELDGTAYPDGEAFVKGRPIAGDFAFTQKGTITLLEKIWQQGITTNLENIRIMALSVLIGILLTVIGNIPKQKKIHVAITLSVLAMLTFLMHLYFAQQIPLINDEGAYAQDAWQTTLHFLPNRDFLTKGPLYIVILKAWQLLVPVDPVLWRGLSAVIWSAIIPIVYILARFLGLKRMGAMATAVALAISPAVIATTTPLLLQVASVAISTVALLFVVIGSHRQDRRWMIGGALLVVAAYLTRASSGVVALLGLVIIFLYARPSSLRLAKWYIATGAISTGLIVFILLSLWGVEKTAITFNVEALVIAGTQNVATINDDSFIRSLTEAGRMLWRGAPWFIGALLLALVPYLRRVSGVFRTLGTVLYAVLVFQIFYNWRDMSYLLPAPGPLIALSAGLLALGIPILSVLSGWFKPTKEPLAYNRMRLVSLLWILLLGGVYAAWFRFVDSYIVEFFVPLAMLFGVVVEDFQNRSWANPGHAFWAKATIISLLCASTIYGYSITSRHPHSGTIDLGSLRQSAHLLADQVPPNEPIFTAQAIITAFAQRPIMFGYSHSGWYLYERVGLVSTPLRQVYFQEPEIITNYLRNTANFVLLEDRTQEVYFDSYPERTAILEENFELVGEVENGGSLPIQLFKRKSAAT